MFGLQTPANAQFGGLMKKAKSVAKDKVEKTVNNTQGNEGTATTTSGSQTTTKSFDPNDPEYIKKERAKESWSREEDLVKKAGGMQKFLELETEDGAVLWRYYNIEFMAASETPYLGYGNRYAKPLVEILRFMKGNDRRSIPRDSKALFERELPGLLKSATDKNQTKNNPMPDKDVKALERESARIRKLWDAFPEEKKIHR